MLLLVPEFIDTL